MPIMLFSPQSVQSGGLSVVLRHQETTDADFVFRLYCSVRGHEFAVLGWPEQALQQFLAAQYRLQAMQYEGNYPGIEQWIIATKDQLIGRFYLWPGQSELRIVDISLLPEWRGKGIGSALIESAAGCASGLRLPLRLSVTKNNPALRLYLRLSFAIVADQDVYVQMERPCV